MTVQEQDDPIGTAARRLFNDMFEAAPARQLTTDRSASQWEQCVDAGFVHALLSEEQGGIGLTLPEFFSTAG